MDEDPVSGGFQHRAGASVSTSTTIPPTRSSNAAHGVPPLALARNHAHAQNVLAISNLRRISPNSCRRRTCGHRQPVRATLLRVSLDHTPSRSTHRKNRFSGTSVVRTFRSVAASLACPSIATAANCYGCSRGKRRSEHAAGLSVKHRDADRLPPCPQLEDGSTRARRVV